MQSGRLLSKAPPCYNGRQCTSRRTRSATSRARSIAPLPAAVYMRLRRFREIAVASGCHGLGAVVIHGQRRDCDDLHSARSLVGLQRLRYLEAVHGILRGKGRARYRPRSGIAQYVKVAKEQEVKQRRRGHAGAPAATYERHRYPLMTALCRQESFPLSTSPIFPAACRTIGPIPMSSSGSSVPVCGGAN